MTAICPGAGPSNAKSGFPNSVQVTGAGLAALAVNWPLLWAVPYLVALEALVLDLSQMCPFDPPADPGITYQDAINVASPIQDPVAFGLAAAKFYQLMKRRAWYQFCECTAAATPAPPAGPAAPAGLPVINPPTAIGPPNTPCGSFDYNEPFPAAPDTGNTTTRYPVPAGATNVNITMGWTGGDGNAIHYPTCCIEWWTAGGAPLGVSCFLPQATNPATGLYAVPATAALYDLSSNGNNEVAPGVVRIHGDWFCGGGGNGSANGCVSCPPDPILSAQLASILGYVRLIQRQSVPFAYVAATVHAGLAGTGTIPVQGLIGVRVAVTSSLAANKQIAGEPTYVYDVGWVSIETADGFIDERRITNAAQVWLPRMMSDAIKIGYSLRAGVTATFTELVREP